MSFEAKESTIDKLLNDTIYSIPRNQRRFVWDKKNWSEFFEDILFVADGITTAHFIGSIVLKDEGKKEGLAKFSIIDGQQRIITITLFIAAIMWLFKEKGMEEDFGGTIKYLQAKDLKSQGHIIVDSEFHGSLEQILINICSLTPETVRENKFKGFIDSVSFNKKRDKKIIDCINYFYDETKKITENSDSDNEKRKILKIRDAIINVCFVNIVSSTEEDSYTIFEILNARGLELEDHELLKNYIMRYIQPEENRDKAKTKWDDMEKTLGASMKKFIKHYATHKYGNSKGNKETAYKIIQKATKGQHIEELLNDLIRKSEYYIKMDSPKVNIEDCSELECEIFTFFKNRRQEQLRPVLLSIMHQKQREKVSEEQYNEILSFLNTFFVCYNIIGEEKSNKLEDTVYKYSQIIENSFSNENLDAFLTSLKNKIPNLDWFTNAVKNVGFSKHYDIYKGEKNKERVRVVLEVLEKHYNNGNANANDFEYSIEHILLDSEGEKNSQIGNLIMLEERLNNRCSDKPYKEKVAIYTESKFKTTQRMAEKLNEEDTFKPEKRTEYIAELLYTKILSLDKIKPVKK